MLADRVLLPVHRLLRGARSDGAVAQSGAALILERDRVAERRVDLLDLVARVAAVPAAADDNVIVNLREAGPARPTSHAAARMLTLLMAEALRHLRLGVLDAELPPAVERHARLDDVVDHVDLLLARDVHCYEVEPGARHARKRDVDIHAYPIAAGRVDVEVVAHHGRKVGGKLAEDNENNSSDRDDRHHAARAGSLLKIVQRFRVEVELFKGLDDGRRG